MAKRAGKASIKRTRRLNQKTNASSTTASTNDPQVDEFYARFLNDDPDRKLTYAERIEILEHSLAKLDAAARKAGLR